MSLCHTHRPSTPKVHFRRKSVVNLPNMRKKRISIGTWFGKLEVIDYAESDRHGNQYLIVRCNCPSGTVKRMRATALTIKPYVDANGKVRRPHTSCGCQSKQAYRDHWMTRASGIRKRVRRNIWIKYQEDLDVEALADQYQLPKPLIYAIVRLYNQRHDASRMSAIPRNSKARQELNEGIAEGQMRGEGPATR